MIQVKIAESKFTPKKKTITVKDVFIRNGMLTDDEGTDVLYEISEALPDGIERFSFKLSFEIPEEDECEE